MFRVKNTARDVSAILSAGLTDDSVALRDSNEPVIAATPSAIVRDFEKPRPDAADLRDSTGVTEADSLPKPLA